MAAILTSSSSARPRPSIQPFPKATLRMRGDTRQCERASTRVSNYHPTKVERLSVLTYFPGPSDEK